MRIVQVMNSSDEVSGVWIFEDGTKYHWGESTMVCVKPDGSKTEIDASRLWGPGSQDLVDRDHLEALRSAMEDGLVFAVHAMSDEEESEHALILGYEC